MKESDLQALVRDGRWSEIGAALTELRASGEWQRTARTFTAYLQPVAAAAGRRQSYLWRCLSAYQFVRTDLSARYSIQCEEIERLPLTAIELIRRLVRDHPDRVRPALEDLIAGRKTYRNLIREDRGADSEPKKALEFQKIAMATIIDKLVRHTYGPEVIVAQNYGLGLSEYDAVIADPDLHWIDGLEVKFHLSSRNVASADRQLRSMATMFRRLWFVCPAGSQEHAKNLTDALASSSIRNVSLVFFDVASNEVSIDDRAILPQTDDQYRRALKRTIVERGLRA